MPDPLPIDPHLPAIAAALRDHQALVLSAAPGSGKTTRIPPALVSAGLPGQVLILQPRRVAARSAARRVAEESGTDVGGALVGYQVRHERRVRRDTRIRFLTEGVLLRRLLRDPEIEDVGTVLLDEFHERHLETDLAISMLQELRETLRPDLRLGVLSATLDVDRVCAALPGSVALDVPGAAHPVETFHRPGDPRAPLQDRVAEVVLEAWQQGEGDVLVFLPGRGEIERCTRVLEGRRALDAEVLPLHGSLTAEQQDKAVRAARNGSRRRVILATNLAESSLTVGGVRTVVDTGLERRPRHDPARGLDRLELVAISRASADQRRGRAGRLGPGRCYRLWSAAEERGRQPFHPPEVARLELSGAVLAVRAFAGSSAAQFGWFEAPPPAALESAEALLARLGATDAEGRVSPVGRELLQLPLTPRLGRLLLAARKLGCPHRGALTAALLSERDPRTGRDPESLEELLERLLPLRRRGGGAGRDPLLHPAAVRAVLRAAEQMVQVLGVDPDGQDEDSASLSRAVLAAWPDRVLRRTDRGGTSGQLAAGRRRVQLPSGAEEWMVALEVIETGGRSADPRVGWTCAIEPEWLEDQHPHLLADRTEHELDPEKGVVRASRVRSFQDLVLTSHRCEADPEQRQSLLVAELQRDPRPWIADSRPLDRLCARLAWVRELHPDEPVPAPSELPVAEVAAEFVPGLRSLRDLRADALCHALESRLDPRVRRLLAAAAPARIRLPSGREAPVEYPEQGEPFVAARLQEFFGLPDSLELAPGRRLLLHLLAPNHRPVQITRDLASFWDAVYPKVRSELRRRYPKHSWPEDPRQAQAEARPRRRPRR